MNMIELKEFNDNLQLALEKNKIIQFTKSFVTDIDTLLKLAIDKSYCEIKNNTIIAFREFKWRGYTVYTFPSCPKGIYLSCGLVVGPKVDLFEE